MKLVKLKKNERPIINAWNGSYNEDPVGCTNIYEINDWCLSYSKNSPDGDTSIALNRYCIGLYQLSGVASLMRGPSDAREWSESVCSALIHITGALMMRGVNCDVYEGEFSEKPADAHAVFYKCLQLTTKVMRQMYYADQERVHRFSQKKIQKQGIKLIKSLYELNFQGHEHLSLVNGFSLAMAKIQNIELSGH